SPVTAMLDVLRFLDKNYTMEMFITHRRLTHTFNKENNDEFFEVNKYSKSHAFNWRSTMDFDDVEAVQQICGDVLHALKLRVFKNKIQYSNYSIDVRLD
ncbi:Sulfotransferase domain, partial [Trinorchestia longiramus]